MFLEGLWKMTTDPQQYPVIGVVNRTWDSAGTEQECASFKRYRMQRKNHGIVGVNGRINRPHLTAS